MPLAWLTLLLATCVILAHWGLISGGGWGGDEFFNFALFRQYGLEWLTTRLLQWSPRPSSDFVLYLYSLAVNFWRMPLIAPFLSILWLALFGTTIAAAWQRGTPGLMPRLALALSVSAMFLLGHRVYDLFFWPVGATPYLLELAGITVVTFQVLAGGTTRQSAQLACALALAVAATSSEVGLFFALTFTVVLFLLERPGISGLRRLNLQRDGWYLVPLLISVVTAGWLEYIVAHNPTRGIDQNGEYYHAFGASLLATLIELPSDVLGGDGAPAGLGFLGWLATFCLLFAGFRWACRAGLRAPPNRQQMTALAAGLAGCYLLTVFTSYYEYSARVHEPQTAFRKCLAVLGVLVAARIAERCWPAGKWLPRSAGPIALCGALCIGMIARAPGLLADYRLLPAIQEARNLTWQSGLDPTSKTLRFYLHPQGEILSELFPSRAGQFTLDAPGIEWWMTGPMQFFGKQRLEFDVVPPTAAH